MTNAKWLALMAAFGLAFPLTLAACDDDDEPTTCQSSEDCADDEECDTSCELCVALDGQCTSDAECDTAGGEACLPFSEGCTIKTCEIGGTGGTGGGGTCEGQADCYPNSYCGEGDACVPLADTVSSCDYGPDAPDANGPMLIWIEQVDEAGTGLCTKDPANCLNNGNVCWFKVTAYDPDGDFPTTGLYGNTRFVRSTDGQAIATFNARNGVVDTTNPSFFDFEVAGCYDQAVTDLAGGFLLLDNANHESNTACVPFANGTAP